MAALKQSIEAVRKQNRDLRLQKNQSLEQKPATMEVDAGDAFNQGSKLELIKEEL